MPPRRKKTKRRRRFTGINVLDAAQAYTQANIWAKATLGLSIPDFLMEQSGGHSYRITLRELLGMGSHGGSGISSTAAMQTIPEVIGHNFKNNWLEAALSSTLTGIGFTAAKKLTKSPRRMANKAIKQLGLGSMVRV